MATIPAGNNRAKGITPNNPIAIKTDMEIIIKIIPTIFVLAFITKAIIRAIICNIIDIPTPAEMYCISACLLVLGRFSDSVPVIFSRTFIDRSRTPKVAYTPKAIKIPRIEPISVKV